jgi:predicted AAA+ superfamily ATPase
MLVDTGLAADLCGAGEKTFTPNGDPALAGALFESLVITEVLKQSVWSEHSVYVSHYRDRHVGEIDLIVEERRSGEVAAIEVKLSSTPITKHAKHLVHTGANTLPLGERIWAVPVSALWRTD